MGLEPATQALPTCWVGTPYEVEFTLYSDEAKTLPLDLAAYSAVTMDLGGLNSPTLELTAGHGLTVEPSDVPGRIKVALTAAQSGALRRNPTGWAVYGEAASARRCLARGSIPLKLPVEE
jgi:hypothetical protein